MTFYDVFLGRIEPNGIVVVTNNAGEVPVGTVFTKLAKISIEGEPGSSTAKELCSMPVSLRLADVIIYRKSGSSIPKGWSAGLHLEGEGFEAISNALANKGKNEFIHLRTADAAKPLVYGLPHKARKLIDRSDVG
jgi:hypothetical protein